VMAQGRACTSVGRPKRAASHRVTAGWKGIAPLSSAPGRAADRPRTEEARPAARAARNGQDSIARRSRKAPLRCR